MQIDETHLSASERTIYRRAIDLLDKGVDAPTFSTSFFGPEGALSQLAGKDRESRKKLIESDLYRWLKDHYSRLRLRDAARFNQDLKAASGRLTVVVPKSLHSALKNEAQAEGVSLSELIRLKLAVPYRQMTDLLIPEGIPPKTARQV